MANDLLYVYPRCNGSLTNKTRIEPSVQHESEKSTTTTMNSLHINRDLDKAPMSRFVCQPANENFHVNFG